MPLLAETPGRRKIGNGDRTQLFGILLDRKWIFFRLTDEAAHFINIVPSCRQMTAIRL